MKYILSLAVLVCVVALALATDAPTTELFKGEISDSQCAMHIHSIKGGHEEMLKGGMTGKNAGECARFCVENMGGKYVLASAKAVYHLDNGKKAEPFAGQRVVIRGKLDKKTNIIAIASIEKDRAPAK